MTLSIYGVMANQKSKEHFDRKQEEPGLNTMILKPNRPLFSFM